MSLLNKIMNRLATLNDQEDALKNPSSAYLFAFAVEGADIEKCQEAACKNPYWAYYFAKNIPEADIKKSLEACKGTGWEDKLNKALMERALR